MDKTLQTAALPALGRLLMSLIFIIGGLNQLAAPGPVMGYIASVGLPLTGVAYIVSLFVHLAGGLAVLAGLLTRWAALGLAVFCLFTAVVFHGFGDQNNMIHAMKDIAMAGGFLYVVAYGAGAWSLDAAMQRRRGLAAQAA